MTDNEINLVREYVRKNFVAFGMCADIAIHNPKGENENPHAHIMLTMRPFNKDKSWGDKQKKVYILDKHGDKIYDPIKRQYKCNKVQTTDWNEKHKAEEWRSAWADIANRYLEGANHSERIDHRSFERQGITDKMPTVHLGVAAHQMEQRGIATERGNINRAIEISNRKLRKLAEQINELQGWLDEERVRPEPPTAPMQTAKPTPSTQEQQPATLHQPLKPTFADVIADILSHQGQAVVNSQTANHILDFLKAKQIKDYAGLENHLKNLMGRQREVSHKYNPVRNRIAELDEHFRQHESFKKYKAQYQQYQQDYKAQMPWKKKAFEQDNHFIVDNYNAAKRYMDNVQNDKKQIPTNAWRNEYGELSGELQKLDREYKNLKTEVDSVNKIRVKVYDILRKEQQRTQPMQKRSQGLER